MRCKTCVEIQVSKDGKRCSRHCPGYNYNVPEGDAWCSLYKNKGENSTNLEEGSMTRAPRRCKACLDGESWVKRLEEVRKLHGLANQLRVSAERFLHSMVDDMPKRIEALRQSTVAYARAMNKDD